MRPGNGVYHLSLPPIPWPVRVVVSDLGVTIPSTGPAPHPYSPLADAFSIAPDVILTCDGDGGWTVSQGNLSLSGTCTYDGLAPP